MVWSSGVSLATFGRFRAGGSFFCDKSEAARLRAADRVCGAICASQRLICCGRSEGSGLAGFGKECEIKDVPFQVLAK